jgi:UDP-glucose 6-dehydrogenase
MQDLLLKRLASGRFQLTNDVEGAIAASKVLFVCVGTPQQEDGAADLSQIEAIARNTACNLRDTHHGRPAETEEAIMIQVRLPIGSTPST